MKQSAAEIVAKAALFGVLACGAASASPGPKIIEIDEAGNVRTSSGADIGRTTQDAKPNSESSPVASDGNAAMSLCDPGYRWLPSGVSADTIVRARAFYSDVTRKYERDGQSARERGVYPSRERELDYWNKTQRFLDSVPRNERKVVERGISPRLSWWCNAPPVIQKPPPPPPSIRR
jgi:hypothetical protein